MGMGRRHGGGGGYTLVSRLESEKKKYGILESATVVWFGY